MVQLPCSLNTVRRSIRKRRTRRRRIMGGGVLGGGPRTRTMDADPLLDQPWGVFRRVGRGFCRTRRVFGSIKLLSCNILEVGARRLHQLFGHVGDFYHYSGRSLLLLHLEKRPERRRAGWTLPSFSSSWTLRFLRSSVSLGDTLASACLVTMAFFFRGCVEILKTPKSYCVRALLPQWFSLQFLNLAVWFTIYVGRDQQKP